MGEHTAPLQSMTHIPVLKKHRLDMETSNADHSLKYTPLRERPHTPTNLTSDLMGEQTALSQSVLKEHRLDMETSNADHSLKYTPVRARPHTPTNLTHQRNDMLKELSNVSRGEVIYYCYSEVRMKLFPSVPTGTLKTWVRNLKILKPRCSVQEHIHFKGRIPDIAIGAFKLISQFDVFRLITHCEGRETLSSPPKKRKFNISHSLSATNQNQSVVPSSMSHSNDADKLDSGPSKLLLLGESTAAHCTHKSKLQHAHSFTSRNNTIIHGGINDNNDNSSSSSYICSSEVEMKTRVPLASENDSQLAPRENFIPQIPVEIVNDSSSSSEDEVTSVSSSSNRRASRKISLDQLDANVTNEIEKFKSFYTRPLNTQRNCHVLQDATVLKTIERLLGYFKYVKDVRPGVTISFEHVEHGDLVEGFCNYLRSSDRNLQSITVSRYVSALISVVRYLHRDQTATEQEGLPSISRLRALQSQLEFDARRERPAVGKKKSILYEEILEIARNLLHEFEDSPTGVTKAKALMNLCILLLYTHATGRCKEFISLRIAETEASVSSLDGNFLVHDGDTLILLCNDYKTKRFYGPDRTVLRGSQLEYHICLYIKSYRSKLLQGASHDFFLVNARGQPFCVASFNKYIGNLFERHCDLRLGVNDIRHSVVSYFLSLPEAHDSGQLLESLATVMRHSVRSQRRFYDDRSRDEKKTPALGVLARKANETIFADHSRDDEFAIAATSHDDDGYADAMATPGDFVALVASNSTAQSPQILLAKVLRYSGNKKDVVLAHFDEVSQNCFRMVTGKSYVESSASVLFPIDLVYNASDRLYELRSDRLDLHRQART